jgi:monooxygenase
MRRHGYDECVPADDPSIVREPLFNLDSGYVRRSIETFPSQGSKRPWRVHQNYALDVLDFRRSAVDDGVLRFSRGASAPAATTPAATPAAA